MPHTEIAESIDVTRDVVGAACQDHAFTTFGFARFPEAGPDGPESKVNLRRIAVDFLGLCLEVVECGGKFGDCIKRMTRIAANRKPSVANACSAADRWPTFTADPNRRVWLLNRFGRKENVAKFRVIA